MTRRITAARRVRRLPTGIARAAMIGVALFLPVAATVGTFIG